MAISITSPVYSARLESIYSSQISTLLAASSSVLEKSDIANSFTAGTSTTPTQSAVQSFDEPRKSQSTSSSQQTSQSTSSSRQTSQSTSPSQQTSQSTSPSQQASQSTSPSQQASQSASPSPQVPQNTPTSSSVGAGNTQASRPGTDIGVYVPANASSPAQVYTSSAPTSINVTA